MPGILADNDVEGHLEIIVRRCQDKLWRDIWSSLGLVVETFETLGLPRTVSDAILWKTCQNNQVVLVTGNRNEDGTDSLEATIRMYNTAHCLPVFTLANKPRILGNSKYGGRVTERFLEHLLDLENLKGTGRIYLP